MRQSDRSDAAGVVPAYGRTDLALEAHEALFGRAGAVGAETAPKAAAPDVEAGLRKETEEAFGGRMRVVRLEIVSDAAAQALGKPVGKYVTFELPELLTGEAAYRSEAADLFTRGLARFFKEIGLGDEDPVLVVGLGNRQVTPDALGPVVAERVRVTRHLFQHEPGLVEDGVRSVAALAPGVMGTTGVETGDIVAAVVGAIGVAAVIVVDALAARSLARLYTTVQMSDAGIQPGSGIGNKRRPLTRETLGVPVIAIGVPTVVEASTIAGEAIDLLIKHLGRQLHEASQPKARERLVPPGAPPYDRPPRFTEADLPPEPARKVFFGLLGTLTEEEKQALLREVLEPLGMNWIVTPKEVDAYIDDLGQFLAAGLNRALHGRIDRENVAHFTH
ncbi:MAG: Endopeptidase spore protease Gpr [Hydrogenibacillus schlegelii]|uniref:Germination protease n=1 Tax=Hydrogenibacillus schlegelii TaxID=1484 RepID=A0A2T5GE20_HYDSH|nr:GPR endopeptidase [Hydrogenibacillus schlegelii]PTQ54405.1 MAG: Endopeptidase spore protease Gpr [Hydrogenibacillus schlegelii]